jgi:hypothetical protein
MRTANVILFLTVLLVLPVAAQQQPSRPDEQVPQVFDRFSGPLSFNSAQGLVQGKVVMQQWQIANGETEEIPHKGLLVVQLRAGSLVTDIEGKRERRHTDSFWSVPASQRLIVHTEHDSVVLQTVDFYRPY